ncbi:hypothetical protein EJ02DRAFT_308693, partial [Clathrospora elynae]
MSTSTYDPCLLVTNAVTNADADADADVFGLKAQFRSKPKTVLTPDTQLDFNGCTLTTDEATVNLTQKGQGGKIKLVDIRA